MVNVWFYLETCKQQGMGKHHCHDMLTSGYGEVARN